MLWLFDLLHQSHTARRHRQSEVARAFHRRAPNWIGKHVITDGDLITAIDWLQINDRVIFRTLAFRPNFERGITAIAHRLDELVSFVRSQPHAETDSLNSRIMPRQIELVHKPAKFILFDSVTRREQSRARAQQGDVCVHPVIERGADLLYRGFKTRPILGLGGAVNIERRQKSHDQCAAKHRIGNPRPRLRNQLLTETTIHSR